jgi:hypothetical protein
MKNIILFLFITQGLLLYNYCFADTLKIEFDCETTFEIILLSNEDTLYKTEYNGQSILINYKQKTSELIRLELNNERAYIIPKKFTQIKVFCDTINDIKLFFYDKDDKFYNEHSGVAFRKKIFNLSYKLVADRTLLPYQQDSIKILLSNIRLYRDSVESAAMLQNAPSKASLFFLKDNLPDRYYSKNYFVKLYKKIIKSKRITKKYPNIIAEIGKKISFDTYVINDVIDESDNICVLDKNKNEQIVYLFITGQCGIIEPNLIALEEKQKKNKNIHICVILSFFDNNIIAICKKNNWAYNLNAELREADFAYKLWLKASFSGIYVKDNVIHNIFNTVDELPF